MAGQISQNAKLSTTPLIAVSGESKATPGYLATRHGELDFRRRRLIMGILNVTPDSFYDGGRRLEPDQAVADGTALVEAGADIIDIGGESTRPGAGPVSAEVEQERVIPVLRALRQKVNVPLSIDTYKSEVARAALEAGADMVNDISAFSFDPQMVSLVAGEKIPVVLMHMQGTPRTMQMEPRYDDVVREVKDFLIRQVREAVNHGIEPGKIIIDPGIGFGKTLDHNLALLRGLPELTALGQPLLVGASRKGFIGKILGVEPDERLEGSLAAAVASVLAGANIIRTHDVRETRRVILVADAVRFGVTG